MQDTLERLEQQLKRKADFWHNVQDDPHGIAQGVAVAIREVQSALKAAIAENPDKKSLNELRALATQVVLTPNNKTAREMLANWLDTHE